MAGSRRMRMEIFTTTSSPPLKLSNYPHRLSDATSDRRQNFTEVLSRQSFTGLPKSSSSPDFFYQEMFRPEKAGVRRRGRSLREFIIPGKTRMSEHNQQGYHENNDFNCGDNFGYDNERSKTSSSVLSSEEFSPLQPTVSGEDYDSVSSFATELIRQINVKVLGREDLQGQQNGSAFDPIYNTENKSHGSFRNYSFGINPENASSETEISNYSYGVSAYDLELNSSSQSDHEEDEVVSHYNFIKNIISDNKERRCESNGVDEAIAWVKQCSK